MLIWVLIPGPRVFKHPVFQWHCLSFICFASFIFPDPLLSSAAFWLHNFKDRFDGFNVFYWVLSFKLIGMKISSAPFQRSVVTQPCEIQSRHLIWNVQTCLSCTAFIRGWAHFGAEIGLDGSLHDYLWLGSCDHLKGGNGWLTWVLEWHFNSGQ